MSSCQFGLFVPKVRSTALMMASLNGHAPVVQALLGQGARVNLRMHVRVLEYDHPRIVAFEGCACVVWRVAFRMCLVVSRSLVS